MCVTQRYLEGRLAIEVPGLSRLLRVLRALEHSGMLERRAGRTVIGARHIWVERVVELTPLGRAGAAFVVGESQGYPRGSAYPHPPREGDARAVRSSQLSRGR